LAFKAKMSAYCARINNSLRQKFGDVRRFVGVGGEESEVVAEEDEDEVVGEAVEEGHVARGIDGVTDGALRSGIGAEGAFVSGEEGVLKACGIELACDCRWGMWVGRGETVCASCDAAK
jgi:hypothetical protein